MEGDNISTETPSPNKTTEEIGSSTIKYRQSGWAPLAYPLSAFQLPTESKVEAPALLNNIQTGPNNVNPYFPLHKHVLFVLIRDLMVVDGVLDPKTFELIKSKNGEEAPYSRHWNPELADIRKENEEDTDKKRKIFAKEIRGPKPKKCKINPKENGGKPIKLCDGRSQTSHTTLGECERSIYYISTDKESKVKREHKKKSEHEPAPNHSASLGHQTSGGAVAVPSSPCKPDEVVSNDIPVFSQDTLKRKPSKLRKKTPPNPNQDVIIIEDSDTENDNIPSSAEELTSRIVQRSIISGKKHPVCDSIIPDFISSSLHGLHVKRSRFVSDADLSASQSSNQHPTFVAKGCCSDEKASFPCVQYSTREKLLHVSIYHEEHLRDTAFAMTKRVVVSFPTYAIRKLLSYRSNAIPRDKMIHLLSTLVFNASHAMYAWQQTEHDLLLEKNEQCLSAAMKTSHREGLDNEIVKLLFNERDLRKIGGFDSSSILPTALLISRLADRGMRWTRFAKTALGRKMLIERGGGGSNYRVSAGWVGAWRKMKYVSLDERNKQDDKDEAPDATSSAKTPETEKDGKTTEAKETAVISPKHSYLDAMSSLVSLHLSREVDNCWGVRLAREGEMCVVMKVSKEKEGLQLKEGDIIIEVRNDQGENLCAPYHSKQKLYDREFYDPLNESGDIQDKGKDLSKWFKQVVGIFKSSTSLDLKVTRVGFV